MIKKLIKIPYYLLIAGVVSVGLLLLATLMPIPGNFRIKIVRSGSMEPYIRTGGIVLIRPASFYKVGDVVTFGPDTKTQIPTTHRIVEEKKEGTTKTFITKGDANDAVDPSLVYPKDIGGRVIFTLPFVGYILDFAKQPLGFILLVGLPAVLVILDELFKIWREIKKIRQKKNIEKNGGENLVWRESRPYPYMGNNILDLRLKIKPKNEEKFETQRRSSLNFKTYSILLLIFVPLLGLSSLGSTVSFYNEREIFASNILQAGAFSNFLKNDTASPQILGADSLQTVEETSGDVSGDNTEEKQPEQSEENLEEPKPDESALVEDKTDEETTEEVNQEENSEESNPENPDPASDEPPLVEEETAETITEEAPKIEENNANNGSNTLLR